MFPKAFGLIPHSTRAAKNAHIISPLIGGLLISAKLYIFVIRWEALAAAVGMIFAVTGFLVQRTKPETQRTFHTYQDIYNKQVKINFDSH